MNTRSILLALLLALFSTHGLACDPDADCRRCLVSAFGRCITYGNDPICESRKKACQIAPPVESIPVSPFGGPNSEFHNLRHLIPARAYLRASAIPPPNVAAYGVVAFRSKPTSATRSRLLRVCEAFKAHLPRQQSLPIFISISDQMLTIWPLDDPDDKRAQNDDCAFAIDRYDLYGGLSAIQDASTQGAKFDGERPFLIGWSPSNTRGIPDKVVLVVDLTSYDSQTSFNEMFLFWQQKIVQNPGLWRSGFSLEGVRLAIKDFVDQYGNDIVNSVKLIGKK